MIIKRDLTPQLLSMAQQFPAVAIMGPRQSGKSTLAKETFPNYAYVSLENLDKRGLALNDPRGFLATYEGYEGLIIDEIQEVPAILSYMQEIIDKEYKPGFFILTGSQQFLVHEKITQSLAGRIALLTLLPLSVAELAAANLLPTSVDPLLIKGFYPLLHAQPVNSQIWCTNYISTYVEKDIRQLLKITDVITFQRFLKLCAARVGNLINYAELARDCEISPHTAKEWLSVLDASYIIKLVAPYHKNYNKRVTKSQKLYFYDTALVCSLLGIKNTEDIFSHPLRGALFESFVISEMFKYNYNHNKQPDLYFWRDVLGHEIDCIIEKSFIKTIPVEIKASKTFSNDFFKGLIKWQKITEQEEMLAYVVYGGDDTMPLKNGSVFAWNAIAAMLNEIYVC